MLSRLTSCGTLLDVMLPNFFVIGAYKSGTTSLNQYLAAHPEIFLPRVKEPSYFAFAGVRQANLTLVYRNSVKSLAEYQDLYRNATAHIAVGDVSPEYMTSQIAALEIHRLVPNAKLIAILRDPVERAYSDFLMYRRDGIEKEIDFAKALERQTERASRSDPTGFYVSTGFYGEQLARYYERFPSSQIKVFLLEELQSDSLQVLSEIFEFLGVDPYFIPDDLSIHNRSGVAPNKLISTVFKYRELVKPLASWLLPERARGALRRKLEANLTKPPIPQDVSRTLRDTYRADVRLLESLTGKSCGNWLS